VPTESKLPVAGETYAVSDRPWQAEDSERIETYIAVTCPLCRTRMVATNEQVGEELVCPDCGTRTTVPPRAAPAGPDKKPSEPADIYSIYEGEGQPPASIREVHRTYIPVVCGVCRTRMLATEDQVGRPITCPDCGTTAIVPPPPPARPKHDPVADVEGEYSLAAEPGQPPSGSVADEEQYAVNCPVCHTRLYATPDQAGKKMLCPDCRREFVVPPFRRKKAETPTETIDTYEIRAPEERTSAVFEVFKPAPREPLPQPGKAKRRKQPAEKSHDGASALSREEQEAKPKKPRAEKTDDGTDAIPLVDWEVEPKKPRAEKTDDGTDALPRDDREIEPRKPRAKKTDEGTDAMPLVDWEVEPNKPRPKKSVEGADALKLDDWRPKPKKPRVEKTDDEDDTFQVADREAEPKPRAEKGHSAAETPERGERKLRPQRRPIEEPLDRHERPKLPRHPFLSGVFNFPWYSSVWVFWAFFSLGCGLVLFLAAWSIQLSMIGGADNYFLSLFVGALDAVVVLLLFVAASAYLLAIVGESSEGADQILAWPEPVYLDWCFQCLHVIVAGGIGLVAGTIAGRFVPAWGLSQWLTIEFGTLVVFPIVLLSVLESGSPIMPISLPVLRSLIRAARGWMIFYLETIPPVLVGSVLLIVTAPYLEFWTVFPAALLWATMSIIYCRLLGRLAWYCAEISRGSLGEDEETEDEDRDD